MFEPIICLCCWALSLAVCQRCELVVLVHLGILPIWPAYHSCLRVQIASLSIQVNLKHTTNLQSLIKFDCSSPEQEMTKLTHETNFNRYKYICYNTVMPPISKCKRTDDTWTTTNQAQLSPEIILAIREVIASEIRRTHNQEQQVQIQFIPDSAAAVVQQSMDTALSYRRIQYCSLSTDKKPEHSHHRQSNPIICKFVRRLASEKILTARMNTNWLTPSELGLPSSTELGRIAIFSNLTPRLQELLHQVKAYKTNHTYK